MAKFKVGDKVRVLPYDKKFLCTGIGEQALKKIAGNLYTITDVRNGGVTKHWYYFAETKYVLTEEMLELSEQPRREFIVIHRSGNVMTAEHLVNREVIKSAKATCAPSDTFDFNTGAKLAFDRLMGREEQSSLSPADIFFAFTGRPAPEPPKFYTGKVVMVDCEFPDRKHLINHLFEFKDGRQVGNKMHGMSFNYDPYTSFEQIVSTHNASTWIEVKE